MLVLTRKAGQCIVICGRITLTVNRIARNRVARAFDAPQPIQIRRSELPEFDDRIDEEMERPPAVSGHAPVETRASRE